uniref:Reverse transcriptase domain-containing protein n=1 Tax=Cacopsylla melanoneura TaxID=428564 RepID=A0A8D9A176_9HEMI
MQLQEDLNSVERWLSTVGLNFHPEKCSIVSYKNNKIKYNYTLGGIPIQSQTQIKDLGIIIQNDLSFQCHQKEIEKKAYRKLGMIIRYSKSIKDLDAIKMLFLAHVRSILEYGSVIWAPKTKKGKESIEKIQKCFIRSLSRRKMDSILSFRPISRINF